MRFSASLGLFAAVLVTQASGADPAVVRSGKEAQKRLNEVLQERGLPAIPASAMPAGSEGAPWINFTLGGKPATGRLETTVRNPLTKAEADKFKVDDDVAVAAARGISVDQLRGIRANRSVNNRDILTVASPRLARFVYRLANPKAEPLGYFQYRNSFLVNEKGEIPPGAMEQAFEDARKMPLNPRLLPAKPDARRSFVRGTEALTPSSWIWRGPGNIGGRIRAMLIHPADRNKLWIGSAGGGIWKSTDGGASWSAQDDFMPNLAVCALIFDPTNPNTMYAGTGEGAPNVDAIRGVGLFKSTDGGATWNKLVNTGTTDFSFVMRLASDSTGTTLLAATSAGVMRSTDSGVTWNKVYTTTLRSMAHVEFHPTDNTKAIASGFNGQLIYSADGGATWQIPAGALPAAGSLARVETAWAKSNPGVVYALAGGQGTPTTRLFKSTNSGATFAEIAITGQPNVDGGQGWYDFLLWVDPTNENRVIVGGVDVWRSTDGGLNFTNITQVYSGGNQHPDMHLFISDPGYNGTTNKRGYILNDGGIARTEDLTVVSSLSGWQKLNNNLGITQFYGGAGNPATGMLIGGTQDNSTLRLPSSANGTSTWGAVIGGDGGYAAVDQTNGQFVYGESQNLALRRSTNGGNSFSSFTTGISGTPEFIAPFILDPNNQNTLLYGAQALFRSVGARTGVAFTNIKANIASGLTITAIGVAPGNSDIIYVGYRGAGGVWQTTNGTTASPTWNQVGTTSLPARRVTRFAIDSRNNNRAFVSFGGFNGGESQSSRTADNLWRTDDGGATWTNTHNNLPAAPIYCVLIDPTDSMKLFVGTDAGVYASENGGATWSGTNVGPSTAPVVELFFMGTDLVAVTHGRGMFIAPTGPDVVAPSVVITPDTTPTYASPITFRLEFSETVTGLNTSSISVTNGTKGTLTGSGSKYQIPVTPTGALPVTVSLSAGAAQDAAGNMSPAASASAVTYDPASPHLFVTTADGASAPRGWKLDPGWFFGTSTGSATRPTGDHTTGGGKLFATALSGNYTDGVNAYLTTPVFDLPAGSVNFLRFWMWMRAETDYDGGNVEISVNGSPFSIVPGASFSVPYNESAIESLPGGAGWSGTSLGAWNRVRMDLTAYAGQSVQFRFHFTSDGGVTETGWFIDDIAVERKPTLALSPTVQAVQEGGSAQVTIGLSPNAPEALQAGLSVGGTAVAGTDYTTVAASQAVPAGASQKVVTVTPIQDGTQAPRRQTVILTLAGGADYTVGAANTATVVMLGDGGYDTWRRNNFTAAQLAIEPSISGVNDTPANDGVSNLLKFGLGLSPFTPSANLLPVSEIVDISGQRFLQIRFVRPSPNANATYTGQVSGDLNSWSSAPADVDTIVTSGPGPNQQTVIYRDRTPITPPLHRFLRLLVATP